MPVCFCFVLLRIVHGRADYVCQPRSAYQLYKALRNAGATNTSLEFVAGAGHSDSEPGLTDAIVRATDSVWASGTTST